MVITKVKFLKLRNVRPAIKFYLPYHTPKEARFVF